MYDSKLILLLNVFNAAAFVKNLPSIHYMPFFIDIYPIKIFELGY